MNVNQHNNMKIFTQTRWQLYGDYGIRWDVSNDAMLPHEDTLEMSGQGVSMIISYGVDPDGFLKLARKIIWPTLRTIPNDTTASLTADFPKAISPEILINCSPVSGEKPDEAIYDGILAIRCITKEGLEIRRTLFPATRKRAALEFYTLTNRTVLDMDIEVRFPDYTSTTRGVHGIYVMETVCSAPKSPFYLASGMSVSYGIAFCGRKLLEPVDSFDFALEAEVRRGFVTGLTKALKLETPDPVLNRAFFMAKLRTTESVFRTKGGLMHCPGGGVFYAAVWANDQAEYAGPFFPFLGDAAANDALLNCYKLFMPFMGPDYFRIPPSIIAQGEDIWDGPDGPGGRGDRGDAAMLAYGATRFALALGNRDVAEELWPGIEWCLEYCRKVTTQDGVVASDTDELEGRFPTGKANLSTSCLAYGGLLAAAHLARSLGKPEAAEEYDRRADTLRQAIEIHFGANVEGFETYRYYDGNETLRSWICLPLAMGITDRYKGTLAAMYSPKLWNGDGLVTEAGNGTSWDRATLYGFRGTFIAGNTETAMKYFTEYSESRLLGEHVPYPLEEYQGRDKQNLAAQLAAESALYCRVITEGLFGITPTGFDSFECRPRLPAEWPGMALRSIRAFGGEFDIKVLRSGAGLCVIVTDNGGKSQMFKPDSSGCVQVSIIRG